jgi:alanine-synthesizing transaminase
MTTEFHRIKRLPPYVFAEVNAMKAKSRAAGADIIDLGMGNPDLPTPAHIVDKLCEVARDPKAHRYSASQGIKGLRKAFVGYYERRFGVSLDVNKEVCVTLGSKEGLANLASAITSPGDIILSPNPAYPIHPFGFIIADGSVRYLPYEPDADFMAALERAVQMTTPKPVALILNYT